MRAVINRLPNQIRDHLPVCYGKSEPIQDIKETLEGQTNKP
jgi:hypothetical protein